MMSCLIFSKYRVWLYTYMCKHMYFYTGNNPSYHVFSYDRETMEPLDWTAYYAGMQGVLYKYMLCYVIIARRLWNLNLTAYPARGNIFGCVHIYALFVCTDVVESNQKGSMVFKPAYTATSEYGMKDISPESLSDLIARASMVTYMQIG